MISAKVSKVWKFTFANVYVTRALRQVLVEYYCQFIFPSSLYASFYAQAIFPLTLSCGY